ncbi:NAD(P)-dependent dehydrogenase (short-subunit alcohol dehydrogenase family) [Crossiella equi]|uniref:NAD(P)-dependent dehydrogenase (Short-subunit alcohol dehydrogenase family) n=1 Tax=Crossiella equi TaxID=130796 RepID=A0ABS5ACX1_9PSEU|nr:oxidoreductase [Crossiella equi]MBP2474439.1 NAD(P)-dependent dehydrogenase (short-subunit alcohol dehydrogenase family) [Crossiella equi]
MTTWFITGASRGFGLELARQALRRGDSVVATARNPESITRALPEAGERLLAVVLDVTDEGQAHRAVTDAVARFGGIDVLVNNAGRGLVGAVEETTDAEHRAVFDTNVFGLLNVTRAVLPVMRRQGHGRILNLSSVGGVVSWAGWGAYCATKFAVEGYSESLRLELAPLGIQVTSVQPGPFRTDFLDGTSLHRAEQVLPDYSASSGAMRSWASDTNQNQEGDPVKAAEVMLAVAGWDTMPARLPLGSTCVRDVELHIAEVTEELARLRELALSTDFAGGGAEMPMRA